MKSSRFQNDQEETVQRNKQKEAIQKKVCGRKCAEEEESVRKKKKVSSRKCMKEIDEISQNNEYRALTNVGITFNSK